jgi:alginate O-acetyltransferase complex protein AlgI
MFGFEFIENFNFPYISQSIREFWRRWHSSLSSWFRAYLYLPLGGNRCSQGRTYLNLLIVFFLCGLWHGASWTFVVWGLYHGVFLVIERTGFGRIQERLWRPLRHGYVLLVVMGGWVLFRAETFGQAAFFLRNMIGLSTAGDASQPLGRYLSAQVAWALVLGIIFSAPVWPSLREWGRGVAQAAEGRAKVAAHAVGLVFETALLITLLLVSAAWLAGGTYNPFIYFRF